MAKIKWDQIDKLVRDLLITTLMSPDGPRLVPKSMPASQDFEVAFHFDPSPTGYIVSLKTRSHDTKLRVESTWAVAEVDFVNISAPDFQSPITQVEP